MSKRTDQMNELLKRAIAEFILEELEMPKEIMVTVTMVSISSDLKYVKVFVSVFPINSRGKALEILNKNLAELSKYLAGKLFLRIIPKIKYEIDTAGDNVEELDEIFKKIEKGE